MIIRQKLREKHLTAVAGITVPQLQKIDLGASMILTADSTDYTGPLVIRDGKVDMCLYEGGYFKATQSAAKWSVCYYTFDHPGNVRAVVDSDGNILQTLHYYPFGSVITELCKGYPAQPYQFGGKEFDRMHGLNWNDFGARRYDPALASWTSPDPLQKDYAPFSPYIYCMSNPVILSDPTGTHPIYSTEGEFLGTDDEGLGGEYYVMEKGNFDQNMSIEQANKYPVSPKGLSKKTQGIINSHYKGLKDRPDYDGTFKHYVHDHKHTYRCVDACPEIEIPHKLFIDVGRCLAFNLKQVKGFDNPSDAIDFIISRVGYHPYYLRSYINRGIDGHVINNIHKEQPNMTLGNHRKFLNESTSIKISKYSVSKQRDDKGRLVVDGDIDAFLKDRHCMSLEEANKKFSVKK